MDHPAESLFDLDLDHLESAHLPLYDILIDRQFNVGRRSAECKWVLGVLICFVRTEEAYRQHGLDSFADWVKRRCGFDVAQAARYELIADFPRDLLRDLDIDVHRLIAVRAKDPVLWPPLLTAAAEGVAEVCLNRAARSGLAHLLRHQDEAAACAHTLAVARGEEAEIKAPPKEPKLSALGMRVVRLLRGGVRPGLAQIQQLKAAGHDLVGRWIVDLWDEFHACQQELVELCQPPESADATSNEARAPAPETLQAGIFPARVNSEKTPDYDDLNGQKTVSEVAVSPAPPAPHAPPAPPAASAAPPDSPLRCPDPCPLCQGHRAPAANGAAHTSFLHRTGCALLRKGRRCCRCGAVNAGSGLTHDSACLIRQQQDNAHAHNWRCTLDPLCVYYQGSPADPNFALPRTPDSPPNRPWLYEPVPRHMLVSPASAPAPAPAPGG